MHFTSRWNSRPTLFALAALATVAAAPAHADLASSCLAMATAEPCVIYTGDVFRHGKSPEAPYLTAGSVVTFTLEYDPSQLTDFGVKMLMDNDGNSIDVHPFGVTAASGALLDYEISAGTYTWTLSEDVKLGTTTTVNGGIGPFPFVAFDGTPTKFLGIEADAINAEGLEFTSQPGDDLLDGISDVGTILDANGHLVALVDTSLDGNIQAARAEDLAVAQVPEPSSWALMLLGGLAMTLAWRKVGRVESRRKRNAEPAMFGLMV